MWRVALLLLVAFQAKGDALRTAAGLLERDDFAGAIPHLRAALDAEPGNVNARFNLAYAYQATGDVESAIQEYGRITEGAPDLVAARRNLATLLVQAGAFADAAREYGELERLLPGETALSLMRAAALRQAGEAGQAAEAYRRVLDLDGASLDALVGLGEVLVSTGHLAEGARYYLKAAELDPAVESLLPGLADGLANAGNRGLALELYRRYGRSRPGDAAVHEAVGLLLLDDGDSEEAARSLELALAEEPRPERHAALAEAYRRNGNVDQAREQLGLAADAAPHDAEARVRYASALLQFQDYEGASREYLAACEADPGLRKAWDGLAFALFQLDNFPGSLRALQHSSGLGPPQAASTFLMALSLDRLEQFEQARDAYRLFLELQTGLEDEAWKAEQRLKTLEKILAKR